MNSLFALAVVVMLLAIYFLPSSLAVNRGHRNAPAIFVANLFLGWTFLGWVVSLVWSLTDNVEKTP